MTTRTIARILPFSLGLLATLAATGLFLVWYLTRPAFDLVREYDSPLKRGGPLTVPTAAAGRSRRYQRAV